MGWHTATHALAWVLGPGLGAALYEVNPDALWWASLAVAALVLAGFLALARRVGDHACGTIESVPATIPPPAELALDQLPQTAS
jgi:hypothetical protein